MRIFAALAALALLATIAVPAAAPVLARERTDAACTQAEADVAKIAQAKDVHTYNDAFAVAQKSSLACHDAKRVERMRGYAFTATADLLHSVGSSDWAQAMTTADQFLAQCAQSYAKDPRGPGCETQLQENLSDLILWNGQERAAASLQKK
jgi:hypothetical protein